MHRQSQRVGVAGRVRVERGLAVLRRALCWSLLRRDGDGLAGPGGAFFVVEECAVEGGRESSLVGEPAASTLKGGREVPLEDKPASASGTQTQMHLWSFGFHLFWGFCLMGFLSCWVAGRGWR